MNEPKIPNHVAVPHPKTDGEREADWREASEAILAGKSAEPTSSISDVTSTAANSQITGVDTGSLQNLDAATMAELARIGKEFGHYDVKHADAGQVLSGKVR